ncbi:hypothetical protein [uncultured Arthrobacter sp.]|uniref:hypothetical protein n=1 Tax=uncultured Arthrobacter sp. TaxID=114050 RepID=UPI002613FFA2|nr:hypothetical protein [uncultured Arthrobacter sp.]
MTWDTPRTSSSRQLTRVAGPAAMAGGLLGALAIFLHSLQPSGCVGSECGSQSMRAASSVVTGVGAVAALLVLIGVVGLTLIARRSGQSPKLMNAGLAFAAVGFLVLLAAVIIQAAFFGGDFTGMPYFVVVGMVALIIGFVLIGIFILRSGVLPRWVGILLVVSSALLLGANEQTSAVLLAIPFQLAVAAAGFFMWERTGRLQRVAPVQH